MPNIDTDNLIKQFWEKVKHKYPNVTSDKFEIICKTLFYYVKAMIERPDMPIILIKFLGKFRVYAARMVYLMKKNKDKLRNGHITQEEYDKRDTFYKQKQQELLKDKEGEEIDYELID